MGAIDTLQRVDTLKTLADPLNEPQHRVGFRHDRVHVLVKTKVLGDYHTQIAVLSHPSQSRVTHLILVRQRVAIPKQRHHLTLPNAQLESIEFAPQPKRRDVRLKTIAITHRSHDFVNLQVIGEQ